MSQPPKTVIERDLQNLREYKLSLNPVQADWIQKIGEIWATETDDTFDAANFIAALTKLLNYVTQIETNRRVHQETPFPEMIQKAMEDWPTSHPIEFTSLTTLGQVEEVTNLLKDQENLEEYLKRFKHFLDESDGIPTVFLEDSHTDMRLIYLPEEFLKKWLTDYENFLLEKRAKYLNLLSQIRIPKKLTIGWPKTIA